MGTPGQVLGNTLVPVVASFTYTTGFVTSGGDWALEGFDQGETYNFLVVAFVDWSGHGDFRNSAGWLGDLFPATLGGNDLDPPVPPGSFAFGGARVFVTYPWSYCQSVPEPSIRLTQTNSVVVSWFRCYDGGLGFLTLMENSDLNSTNWTPVVTGAVGEYEMGEWPGFVKSMVFVPKPVGSRFFRLLQTPHPP
jgi:hypothetical protein